MNTIPEKLDPKANKFAENFQKIVKRYGPKGVKFNVLLDSEENTAAGPADGDLDLKVIPKKSFKGVSGYNAGERAVKALNIPGNPGTFGTGFTPSEQFVVSEVSLSKASEYAKSLIPKKTSNSKTPSNSETPSNFEGSLPGPKPDTEKMKSSAKKLKNLAEQNSSVIVLLFFILGAIGISIGPFDFE